jgi:hypothetical protein
MPTFPLTHLDRDPDAELRSARLWASILTENQQRHAVGSPEHTLYAQALAATQPLIAHFAAEGTIYGGTQPQP